MFFLIQFAKIKCLCYNEDMTHSKKAFRFFLITVLFFLTHHALFASGTRPVVTDIQAHASGSNKITITWTIPSFSKGQHIAYQRVYRANRPFTSTADLSEQTLLATVDGLSASYTDTLDDYREYYYAVIALVASGDFGTEDLFYDEELDAAPAQTEEDAVAYLLILPGVNATVTGSRIPLPSRASLMNTNSEETASESSARELRNLPLAYISFTDETNLTGTQTGPRTISERAEKSAQRLAGKRIAPQVFTEPYVFEEDLVMPAKATDDYELFNILKTSFIRQNWAEASKQLRTFLSQNRSVETVKRARFYLGECYYFMQNYADAVTCFLSTEEVMSPLVRKWSENALDLYQIPQ
jgi:tetratricopeptide (TPR) repeat protein